MSFAGTLLCGIDLPKLKPDCMSSILLVWQKAISEVDPANNGDGDDSEVALVLEVRNKIVARPFSTPKALIFVIGFVFLER